MLKKTSTGILLILLVLFFAGCPGNSNSSNNSNNKTRTYKVSLKNLTSAQTFAPAGIIVQNSTSNFNAYKIGTVASVGLETLAESGNPQVLLDEAKTSKVLYTNKFSGTTAPGSTKELEFTVDNESLNLSILAMLVKTNDAFVAGKSINLNFTDTKTFNLNVYDAGTEANDELATTVPALKGEGFNSIRNDTNNFVTVHSGLVTKDDGLPTSALSFSDKWDNPAAILTIERIK